MKILIIGDSHGNIANLKHVMGFGKKIGVKAVIHTGDWNTLYSVEVVESYKILLYSVLGNADIDPAFKKRFKENLEIVIDGRKIYLIHKFLKSDKNYLGKDIVFSGHYHSQYESDLSEVKIVRPGALESTINFAVYDTSNDEVKLINEQI